MGKSTRRDFIKQSGFTLVSIGVSGRAFFQHTNFAANSALTAAAALSDTGNILVVVQMAGGNDGLHSVIPVTTTQYNLYEQKRTTLAIPQNQVLPLNAEVGLNPKLSKFKALYDAKKLAVIQGVGYPNPNRSHFRSMDIWHTANPEKIEYTGWLGDTLDIDFQSSTNPLLAATIGGGSLPRSLRADETPVPAIASLLSYKVNIDDRYRNDGNNNQIPTFLALNREARMESAYHEQIRKVALDSFSSSTAVQQAANTPVGDPSAPYPAGLGGALKQCSQILASNLGTRILYVTIGGFDTHQNQDANFNGQQSNLLTNLSTAIDAFLADLNRQGKADNVLVMAWSEFGRRVQKNPDNGTDHGAAAPVFVLGNRVKGGVVGTFPSLSNLDNNGDVRFSIDFRSVYATILQKWLGVDYREVIPGYNATMLDFLP